MNPALGIQVQLLISHPRLYVEDLRPSDGISQLGLARLKGNLDSAYSNAMMTCQSDESEPNGPCRTSTGIGTMQHTQQAAHKP
jgi:hypothetical protein